MGSKAVSGTSVGDSVFKICMGDPILLFGVRGVEVLLRSDVGVFSDDLILRGATSMIGPSATSSIGS